MKHSYGPVPDGDLHGKIGVIVASQPRGEVANLIYCGNDLPLFIVPRALYENIPPPATSGDAALPSSSSKTSKIKCKEALSIGDQVEFEEFGSNDESRYVVKWMVKAPNYLPIDCRSASSPQMDTVAVITTSDEIHFGEKMLWSATYRYIDASDEQIEGKPEGVPMWCRIELVINYGAYEGAQTIPLRGFQPYYWFRLVRFLGKKSVDPLDGADLLREMLKTSKNDGNQKEEGEKVGVMLSRKEPLETFFDRAIKTTAATRAKSGGDKEDHASLDAVGGSGGSDENLSGNIDHDLTEWMKKCLGL